MDCEKFKELLLCYLEGELDSSKKKQFEEHMETCGSCKTEYLTYSKLMNEAHALTMEQLPDGYCKELHKKLEEAKKLNVRKKRNNIIKYVSIAALCLIVFSSVYILGNNISYGIKTKNYAADMGDMKKQEASQLSDSSTAAKDENNGMMYDEPLREEFGLASAENYDTIASIKTSNNKNVMESKIIKSGNMNLHTYDFDKFMNSLDMIIREKNGYFEYNETSVRYKTDSKEYKSANIKLRVPQETFYEVVEYIEENTDVYNRLINESDVTKEYYDTKNIVTNLEIQENKLRDLYDKAANITEILSLENEITRVRTQIDAYNINLSNIDDRVSMATIELRIDEVEGEIIGMSDSKRLWDRAREGLVRTVNNIIDGIESVIVWFISYLPIIILIAIAAVIICTVIKKRKK